METFQILAIDPGSTSTKIAIYENEKEIFRGEIQYLAEEISGFGDMKKQYARRKDDILKLLEKSGRDVRELSAVVGRGGALPPVRAGAYLVGEAMLKRLMERPVVPHAANIGAPVAFEIARSIGKKAYIYDAIAVDEVPDICQVTGISGMRRLIISHTLNMRAAAIKRAEEMGADLSEKNFIVAHLGGGISICALCRGRIADVVVSGEGPFSPNRMGSMSPLLLARYIYSGKHSKEEVMGKIMGRGGLIELLGTDKVTEAEARAEAGEERARLVYEAMAYQVAKGICEMGAILCGQADGVILTGGIAHSQKFTELVRRRVEFLAPVTVYPGENELESLAKGVLRVLRKEEAAQIYRE